tara:strand:- start:248 stop:1447 length:1200 start_codon:yes stop_codon:yes gene_type:complete
MTTKLRAASFQDSAVTTAKIAADAITNPKIADDAVQTENVASTVNLGRRNLVINGAMNVSQRSTSVTGLGDGDEGYVTLDRMRHTAAASAGRFTSAQTAISDLPGFLNCLHLDCTTADTSISSGELLKLEYRMEGQDVQQLKKGTSDAEKITVSFYMKTNKAFTFMCELDDRDNNRVNTQQFTTSTSFTRHVLTFAGDTTGALDDDTAASFAVGIYLHAGSDFTGGTYSANTWQSRQSSDNMRAVGIGSFYDSTDNDVKITGLQVEVGEQATPFEHRSYAEELALCQRYLFVLADGTAGMSGVIAAGSYYNASTIYLVAQPPVQMRASPSLTTTNSSNHYIAFSNGAGDHFETLTIGQATPSSLEFFGSGAVSATSGAGTFVRLGGTSNTAKAHFEAEL